MHGVRQELARGLRAKLSAAIRSQDLTLGGFRVPARTYWELSSSLLSGHHLLVVGPIGSGKTTLALGVASLLGPRVMAASCPMGCTPGQPECPWCQATGQQGEITWTGIERAVRIQASPQLSAEEMLGGPDPQLAMQYGFKDIRAFRAGKMLRAQHGVLVIDGLDHLPGRVQTLLRYFLEGEMVLPEYDTALELDTLVVATVSPEGLGRLGGSIKDHFDVIEVNYLDSFADEQNCLPQGELDRGALRQVLELVRLSRDDQRLSRGASTRAAVKLAEVLNAYHQVLPGNAVDALPKAAQLALPHRIRLTTAASASTTTEAVVAELVDQLLAGGQVRQGGEYLPAEVLEILAEEVAMNEEFRRALSKGHLNTFLQLVKDDPGSEMGRLFQRVLAEVEAEVAQGQLAGKNQRQLELEAVRRAINLLEQQQIFQRDQQGWRLAQQGVGLLIQRLTPQLTAVLEGAESDGNHRLGRKVSPLSGEMVGVRPFALGDRYRDVALRDSLRQAIRHRHRRVERNDVQVWQREKRTRLDVVIAVDISGTMAQLEKYWLSKRVAVQLALAYLRHGDRVGVVAFANEGRRVQRLSLDQHRVTEAVVNLEIDLNSFTNISSALDQSWRTLAAAPGSPGARQVILISDGEATAPKDGPEQQALTQALRLHRDGVVLSTVCLNEQNANPRLMAKLARVGGGRFYLLGPDGFTRGSEEALG